MRVGNSLWVLGYWSFLECYLFSIMMHLFPPQLLFRALMVNCIHGPGEGWCKEHKVLPVSMSTLIRFLWAEEKCWYIAEHRESHNHSPSPNFGETIHWPMAITQAYSCLHQGMFHS